MKIISFFKTSNKDRLLFFEAFLLIAISRILIRFFSFKKLMQYLGEPQKELPITALSANEKKLFLQISKAIKRAARYSFWHTMCYEQALTAKLMLRRRKTNATIYIGMMKSEEKGLEGHAWIRSGDYILTGDHQLAKYTIVGVFS
jgi:hypothetical protein